MLPGAGVNLEQYRMVPYPHHSRVHFLYLGRIMKEKGIGELFYAVRRLKKDQENFVLDLVGFFEEEYKGEVEELEQKGMVHFYGFQANPCPFYAAWISPFILLTFFWVNSLMEKNACKTAKKYLKSSIKMLLQREKYTHA